MKILEIQQNTPEWLEFRRMKIGASDANAIMEASPWTTPYKLWEEKLGLVQNRTTLAMEDGHRKESIARNRLMEKWKMTLMPLTALHNDLDWMMASFDAISTDLSFLAEIKSPGEQDHHYVKEKGSVPPKYYPQLQHQMVVSGLKEMVYASYFENQDELLTVFVLADSEYQDQMIQKEISFLKSLVNFEPPKMGERDFVFKDDTEWNEAWAIYEFAENELKSAEQAAKRARDYLIGLTNDCNCRGRQGTIQKVTRMGNVDYGSIPELKNVDLDKYRKAPSSSWRVSRAKS